MFLLAAKKHGNEQDYLYLCRAEISTIVTTKGSVYPFSVIK